MSEPQPTVLGATNTVAHEMAAAVEAQLLAFFGTIENAQRLAHIYVIEHHPLVVESEFPGGGGAVRIRASQTWRVRLKTEEELAEETHVREGGSTT